MRAAIANIDTYIYKAVLSHKCNRDCARTLTYAYVLCWNVGRSRASRRIASRRATQFNPAPQLRVRVGASVYNNLSLSRFVDGRGSAAAAGLGLSIRVRSIRSSRTSRAHAIIWRCARSRPGMHASSSSSSSGSSSFVGTEERLYVAWCLNNHTRDIPVAMKFTECRSKARMYVRQRIKLWGGSTLSSHDGLLDARMEEWAWEKYVHVCELSLNAQVDQNNSWGVHVLCKRDVFSQKYLLAKLSINCFLQIVVIFLSINNTFN